MSCGEDKARRWQIGIGDFLIFVAGIGLSFGLFTLAANTNSILIAELSVLTFGGIVGSLFGRLHYGTERGSIAGFCVGALATILLQCVILMNMKIE